MASRPEVVAPPEIFYDDSEARKYTSSSRIVQIQVSFSSPSFDSQLHLIFSLWNLFVNFCVKKATLSERALELLALPDDGIPKLLLDIGNLILFNLIQFDYSLSFSSNVYDLRMIAVGCGSGLSGETLTEDGHHWIGLDISASMLSMLCLFFRFFFFFSFNYYFLVPSIFCIFFLLILLC